MVRTPSCDKSGLRKGTWTPEEDRKLIAYVTRYGTWNWRQLPRFAGLARCGKSCRLRWMNYLRPNLKRGNFTQEEEDIVIRLHAKLGNRWSTIAAELPGRTDNEVKNHWHTTLKKRVQQNAAIEEPKSSKLPKEKESITTNPQNEEKFADSQISDIFTTTCPLSPLSSSSSSEFSSMTTSSDHTISNENLVIEDDDFAFLDGSFWTEPYLAEILHTPAPSEDVNNNTNNGNGNNTFQSAQEVFDDCAMGSVPNGYSNASLLELENELGSLIADPTVENFWTQPYQYVSDDVSHVLSSEPFVATSDEYFSTVYGADLWGSTQSNLYDQHLSLF